MADKIDLNIKIGSSLSTQKLCPAVISTKTPVITWTLPAGINQKRYNVKITNLESGGGLFQLGETVSTDTYFDYPTSNPFTDRFLGLCSVEIAISESSTEGALFEYTSGDEIYFVYDSETETIYNDTVVECKWKNSTNEEDNQQVYYDLQLATDPLFDENDLIYSKQIIEDSVSSRTSSGEIDVGDNSVVFWRVRAYDGYDYSDWTEVNGFNLTDNQAPEITIDNITVTDNEYFDVIIDFTIVEYGGDYVYIEPYYLGGSVGDEETLMSLINSTLKLTTGSHQITWRSSRDEVGVEESDDYQVKLVAIDTIGQEVYDISETFTMDNSLAGEDTGGIGSVDIEFPIKGILGDIIGYDYSTYIPNTGIIEHGKEDLTETVETRCFIETFQCYYAGGIFTEFSQYWVQDSDGYYNGVTFPYGISAGGNSLTIRNLTDLDSGEVDFVKSLDYVNSSGYYIPMKDYDNINDLRSGYVRFYKVIYGDRSVCEECGGKGWRVEDLIYDEESGYYQRVPCSYCHGNRFSLDPEDKTNVTRYLVSFWRPIEDVFYPCNTVDTEALAKISFYLSDFPYTKYLLGEERSSTIEDVNESELFIQVDGETAYSSAYQMNGFYNNIPLCSWLGKNVESTETDTYPISGYIGPEKYDLDEHINPNRGTYVAGKEDYVSVVPDRYGIRGDATNKWEYGIWSLSCEFTKVDPLEDLGFLYLQSGWDTYNTLHWKGTVSTSTRIQIQVTKFLDDDGSRTEYEDVITEFSEFNQDMNCYLITPSLWYAYWNSGDQDLIETGYDYRLRIRQCDLVSKTYSSWVYSAKFYIDEDTPNPVNITDVQYNKWTKELSITFRVDDTQGDDYDIVNVYYSEDSDVFTEIRTEDLDGNLTYLSSITGLSSSNTDSNYHTIIWNTETYQLEPSDDYRIKIEARPSKYTKDLDYPVFTWSKAYNPVRAIAEDNIVTLNGSVQYFYYDSDGNYVKSDDPIVTVGDIENAELEMEEYKLEPSPSGVYAYMDESGNIIDVSGYQSWMSYEIASGVTRNDILMNMAQDISDMKEELQENINTYYEQEREVRRYLIDQGYYCNGFNSNTESEGQFLYYVIGTELSEDVVDEEGNIIPVYKERYEIYDRFQMDFYSTFDSQSGYPLRDLFYDSYGDRIQGSNDTADGLTNSDGEEYTTTSTYDYNFDSIELQEGETSGNSDDTESESTDSSEDTRSYHTFYMEEDDLPGEWSEKFLDNTRNSVTDVLPSGVSSFTYDYKWRVASYNIVTQEPIEDSTTEIESFSTSNNIVTIKYKMAGDRDIQTASVNSIYYIDEYTDDYALNEVAEISMDTDVDDTILESDSYTFPWMPMGKDRTRPFVIKENSHEYYLFYTKKNNYSQNCIVHARGKTPVNFGEYNMVIPNNMNSLSSFISGITQAYNCCILKLNSIYHIWFTAYDGSTNKIMHTTSDDCVSWETPESVTGISSIYSPYVIYEDGIFYMYYGKYENGFSIIKMAQSTNGTYFTSEELIVDSLYNLDCPCVITHNGERVVFYTENTSTVQINNTRNDIFPIIEGGKNPCIIKDNYVYSERYRIFYNEGTIIKTGVLENYTLKEISTSSVSNFVSGEYSEVESSVEGTSHTLYINSLSYYYGYRCNEEYRNNLNNVLQYVIFTSNDLEEKEYLVQSAWVSEDNVDDTDSTMSPDSFNYDELIKELAYN